MTKKNIEAALKVLRENDVDVNKSVCPIAPLAREVADRTGCHYMTARKNITKAVRILRGEEVERRGGARAGAGRPPGLTLANAKKQITLRLAPEVIEMIGELAVLGYAPSMAQAIERAIDEGREPETVSNLGKRVRFPTRLSPETIAKIKALAEKGRSIGQVVEGAIIGLKNSSR